MHAGLDFFGAIEGSVLVPQAREPVPFWWMRAVDWPPARRGQPTHLEKVVRTAEASRPYREKQLWQSRKCRSRFGVGAESEGSEQQTLYGKIGYG